MTQGFAKTLAAASGPPVGSVVGWSGLSSAVPGGWALCDGSTLSATTYPALAAVRGASGGLITLPDLRGRMIVGEGTGAGLTARARNATGGSETIASADMPVHSHGPGNLGTGTESVFHQHTLPGGVAIAGTSAVAQVAGGAAFAAVNTWGATDNQNALHTHAVTTGVTGNAGGGAADGKLPPYYVLAYIIRTLPLQDRGSAPPLVTSLPASPPDGYEVFYLADDTNSVIWHLRYRATAASAYKWEYVGGTPMTAYRAGDDSTTSTSPVTLNGPSLTLPLAGFYVFKGHGVAWTSAGAPAFPAIQLRVNNVPQVGASSVNALVYNVSNSTEQSWDFLVQPIGGPYFGPYSAGHVAQLYYWSATGGATSQFRDRHLTATPVRVS